MSHCLVTPTASPLKFSTTKVRAGGGWVGYMICITCVFPGTRTVTAIAPSLFPHLPDSPLSVSSPSTLRVPYSLSPSLPPSPFSLLSPPASSFEESDFIDSFEKSMLDDVRLQLLRKRLQSKKELLKQLDRMYSCFVAGNGSSE